MGNVVHGTHDAGKQEKESTRSPVSTMESHGSKLSPRSSNAGVVDVNFKARLQHKLYLAQENPNEEYDLSDCKLKHVPSGTYSLCKVMQKEILLLQSNCLVNLQSGGNLGDLSHLRILNLSHNSLEKLPEEMCLLQELKVLYLDYNRCKHLPESLGKLKSLEILSISHNKLKDIPNSLGRLGHLTELDLSNNCLSRLPSQLSQLISLKRFSCESNSFDGKLAEVCQEGWESLQIVLLKEFELGNHPSAKTSVSAEFDSETEPTTSKAKLLRVLSNDESMFQEQLLHFQKKQEAAKRLLLENLEKQEEDAQNTIQTLLSISQVHRDPRAMLAMLKREQEQIDHLLQVRQEEYATLRKSEVMKFMQNQLEEELQLMRRPCKILNASDGDLDGLIQQVLNSRQSDHDGMLAQLFKDEDLQKQAFISLLSRKDERGRLVQSQIEVIVQELSTLSLLEIQRKESKLQIEMNALCEKRQDLAVLLKQLLEQQQERQQALQAFLLELEEQRAGQSKDYWLLQFQRLLDSKPQAALEEGDNAMTREILKAAGALEYELLLSVKRVSLATGEWTDNRLKQVGISHSSARIAILEVLAHRQSLEEASLKASAPELEAEPSAPTLEEFTASADLGHEVYLESCCVVCLDQSCQLLFLHCGHVCCCTQCGKPLDLCPLCRTKIAQKVCLSN